MLHSELKSLSAMGKQKRSHSRQQTAEALKHAEPLRRSARLRKLRQMQQQEDKQSQPSSQCFKTGSAKTRSISSGAKFDSSYKRRRAQTEEEHQSVSLNSQHQFLPPAGRSQQQLYPEETFNTQLHRSDPITHWTRHGTWPADFTVPGLEKRIILEMDGDKTLSSWAKLSEVERQHMQQGVSAIPRPDLLSKQAKTWAKSFLEIKYDFAEITMWPEAKFNQVLGSLRSRNEMLIQRDMMPRLVPPASILRLLELDNIKDWIYEDLDALWSATSKGGSAPKPDYTAGVYDLAFSDEEIVALKAYSNPERPFLFCPRLAFPFLTAEAKSGNAALRRAHTQNVGNGAVALNAILELYKIAFETTEPERVAELYGKILFFSISHDDSSGYIWGHFAIRDEDVNEYHYYQVGCFNLSTDSDETDGRFMAHNFTRAVYEKFAPQHLKRIKIAAARLVKMRAKGSATFNSTSLISNGLSDALSAGLNSSRRLKDPVSPSTTLLRKIEMLEAEREQQKEKLEAEREQQKERLEAEREQQKEMTKARDRQIEATERQLEEMKEKVEQQQRQIDELLSLARESQRNAEASI